MKKYGLLMIVIAVLALMTACGNRNQNGGTITIIKGEPAEMPDVTNATLASATETLSEAGFTNVISEYYGGTVRNPERMVVTGQSCPAGESVDRYTEIILTCRKLCGVNLDITSKNNWIFSKYDMLVKFDGRELGKVANGETLSANLDIVEGSYVLQILNADDPSLAAEYQLEVTEDMGFACMLSHSDKEIRFNKVVLDVGKPVDVSEAEVVDETEGCSSYL